ncbi:DUF5134 domain-containing protein [Promicromonospora sp. Populi]|uniref:DUF5134 domain-containing protein n=1 Tax=Promicromonospora sp. Populi TaxID=3239420 RepID=UPI0034E2231F
MPSDPVVQWAVAGVFAALSAHSVWRLATARQVFVGLGYLFHLGMNLDMVAMVWPWWAQIPTLSQLGFFAVGAVFFASAAGWYAGDALPRGAAGDRRQLCCHHRDAPAQAAHAVMMLAMVWAVAVMSQMRHAGHGAHAAPLGSWTTGAGVLLAAALLVGGALFLVYLSRHLRERGSVWDRNGADHVASALMSLGMVAMCGLMLSG